MIGAGVLGAQVERLDLVDGGEHLRDLRPA